MKKRSLSLLLALLMVLSLIVPGTAAFADDASQWPSFRGSETNMAISTAKTPGDAQHTALDWANKLSDDWSKAPSAPIIVGDKLVTMCGDELTELALDSGAVVKTAKMKMSTSYGLAAPTYADGLIIAPLDNGVVEAFDAVTLDSKWVYTDKIGGQSSSPVLYSDGKLYVGFWKGEAEDANFVCIDAATGSLDWSYAVKGGFYFAGAVAVGDYIFVGTDDGAKGSGGSGTLLAFKKTYSVNEEVIPVSSAALAGCGDVRSSLAYSDGKVYFTTKGGYLGSAAVDGSTGEISGVKTESFGAQSTSTPVVYGDYVYFGAGNGFSDPGLFVIADKNSLEVKNTVELKGYAQCSMLLSTAYLETDGYLYFYSTYNTTPGGVALIKVKADDVSKTELIDIYDADGFENYCICSIICDTDGNIYYKNDSGTLFCLKNEYSEDVLVSIADKGSVELSYATVTATDLNSDGIIDIDEVLYAAHNDYYAGGAAKGYASASSEYGAYIAKLWGDESGNFGYFVDNKMAMSLNDKVEAGQHVYAYVNANAYPNNDAYAYFESSSADTAAYAAVTIKLTAQNGYDENWNPKFEAYDKAQLKAYSADLTTEAEGFTAVSLGNGEYKLSFTGAGEYNVVATADNNAIIPAACKVSVRETQGFNDVKEGSYYYDAAMWGGANGVVNGYGSGEFRPDGLCTRAQIVSFLYRLAGSPEVSGECSFKDVPDSYYKNAVIWAAENEITYGTTADTFSPNDVCTRAQAMTMLYRYLDSPEYEAGSGFADVADGAFYADAVMWAEANGVAKGFNDSTFRPYAACTRAQIVTFIYRAAA